MTTYRASTAAQRGAALLDKKHPLWYNHINTETLKLDNPDRCVVGQLYGGYLNGLEVLGIHTFTLQTFYGFYIHDIPHASYAALTKAWVKAILKRRGVRDGKSG